MDNGVSGSLVGVSKAIDRTPLMALDRITPGLDGRIIAKLEYLNPRFPGKTARPCRLSSI